MSEPSKRAYDERGNVRPADERWLGDPEPASVKDESEPKPKPTRKK